jgi:2-oxoglutarate ferredoxin oxidoreductase subunit delta
MPADTVTTVRAGNQGTIDSPVAIDAALCKACGICIGVCPKDVLEASRHGVAGVERPEDCTACRICELHCPEFAIRVRVPARSGAALAESEQV